MQKLTPEILKEVVIKLKMGATIRGVHQSMNLEGTFQNLHAKIKKYKPDIRYIAEVWWNTSILEIPVSGGEFKKVPGLWMIRKLTAIHNGGKNFNELDMHKDEDYAIWETTIPELHKSYISFEISNQENGKIHGEEKKVFILF